MSWTNTLPEWVNEGTEPSEELRTTGFQGGYKPPAAVFNWFWHNVSKAVSELQTEVLGLAEKVAAGTPIVDAVSEDGATYTATVEGATELYDGMKIILMPNIVSSTTSPTLNVNGLGAIRIGMLSSFNNAAVVPAPIATFLSAMRPVEVTFHQMRSTVTGNVTNQYWIVDWRRPSASSLYGQVPVQNGGWYINTDTTDEDKAEALEALQEIGVGVSKVVTVTLSSSNWSEGADGRYYQTVTASNVAADTPVVTVDPALTGTDLDADAATLEAWQYPSANNIAQGDGTLTFYSYEIPAVNIPINVGVA